jgi:predicted RNA binding protein YcfA (HicA-like mRNA interferase family)
MPRDVSGRDLAKAMTRLGYEVTRQVGSHIRLTRHGDPSHHVTVPNHDPIKLGTLSTILRDLASHLRMSRDDLMRELFG